MTRVYNAHRKVAQPRHSRKIVADARPCQFIEQHIIVGDITCKEDATVLIEGGGKVIYIDPAKPADFTGLPAADLILITHEHTDHLDRDQTSIKKINKAGTQIWATLSVSKFVSAASVMSYGQTRKLEGWTVEAVPAYNMVRGPSPGQFFHPKGVGNGYVLNFGGMRFYFSGDTECTPEMKALKDISIAFVAMNPPRTMSTLEAAACVKAFRPKIVYPYHYRGQNLDEFASALKGTGIDVRIRDWYAK